MSTQPRLKTIAERQEAKDIATLLRNTDTSVIRSSIPAIVDEATHHLNTAGLVHVIIEMLEPDEEIASEVSSMFMDSATADIDECLKSARKMIVDQRIHTRISDLLEDYDPDQLIGEIHTIIGTDALLSIVNAQRPAMRG